MPKHTAEPVTWRLTDHVCRVCFGRVLERFDEDGQRIVRCANCGTEVGGKVKNLCCCGLKTPKGRDAGLRCGKNENRSPDQPAEVAVYWEPS